MNKVYINNIDLFEQYGIVMQKRDIPFPVPKTSSVIIEGMDGEIDLTGITTGGCVKYSNRTIKVDFSLLNMENYEVVRRNITKAFHGKKVKLKFSDDTYEFIGRCEVQSYDYSKAIKTFSMSFNVEPYKYEANELVYEIDLDSEENTNIVESIKLWRGVTANYPVLYAEMDLKPNTKYKLTFTGNKGNKVYLNDALFERNEGIDITISDAPISVIVSTKELTKDSTQYTIGSGWKILKNQKDNTISADFSNVMVQIYEDDVINHRVYLENLEKWVEPQFNISDNAKLKFGNTKYSLGTGISYPIMIQDGRNEIWLSGTGNATISYKRGVL